MPERERVAVMVAPDTKETWQTAVKQSTEYSSLSDLIRRSVTHELSDGSAPASPTGESAIGAEALEDLTESLRRIETKIETLDSRVSGLEGETAKSDAALIKNKIFTALNGSDEGKTAERLADEIGFPEEEVTEQLQNLRTQTGLLESFEPDGDGKTRYYTENN